ncbi:uncharacterized protein CELE_Y47D3A.32 [Caenorhabditis elegans]|uniref:Uncharacterized protein n=1 Tax=Caenorhabditis elegans TaxID=6239 RepID=D0Z5N8_CAEEL|nr:Uncharacterized protein CELE_Y47D3A.32 [Caenorhabditis elegans]CBI63242.1 Uncharacterized protein CELE_Y47D3A.32 [Caenorhabditis elegans]|eukprot:NP_001255114.1 Uncharacterized protein CELE_Y47D3A.32 [Caenorhabditis elegans]
MATFMEGEIIEEILHEDIVIMNETIIVDMWNVNATTGPTIISAKKEQLYESLILSGSAIIFILLAILILYYIKTSRYYRHWWRGRQCEKAAKKEEKARLKAKVEREKLEQEDEEEYSV